MTNLSTALSDFDTAFTNYNKQIVDFTLQRFVKITATGTLTVPKNITSMLLDGTAAGGAGGGVPARTTGNTSSGGGGGGSGQAVIGQVLTVTPEETLTITIGAPGVADGSGNAGAAAGNITIVGSVSGALFTLNGGSGGAAGVVSSTVSAGGAGGIGYPDGENGQDDINVAGFGDGGRGADNPFGTAGGITRNVKSRTTIGTTKNGYGYGAGGSAGSGSYDSTATDAGCTGSDGQPGFVMFKW